MKKYIVAIAAIAAFAGFSFAQGQTEAPKPAEPAKMEAPKAAPHKAMKKEGPKADMAIGALTAIDTTKNEITVNSKGADRVIGIDAAKLANLKVGDHVKVKVVNGKAETVKVIHEGKKAQPKK